MDESHATSTPSTGEEERSRGLQVRDLITVGVFAALYVVVVFAINFIGFVNPVAMLIGLALGVLAGGVPFMLFLTRVHKPGMILLFAVIVGGLLMLTGHTLPGYVLMIAVAVLAEVIVRMGGYASRRASVAAYTVFSVWVIGQLLPLFYDREGYLSGPGMQQMGADYLHSLDALLSVPLLIVFDVIAVVCGYLGAQLGLRLLDKHFRRAGLA